MEPSDRIRAIGIARGIESGRSPADTPREESLALALLAADLREVEYQRRIAELQDAVERTARSGVENAARYAADLAAAKRDGAAAVERIRAAVLEGASDAEQASVLAAMLHEVENYPPAWRTTATARAYLALSASHAEARALLDDIGARARALLGKVAT
jgi:uncharacterized protein YfaS (alpha-2-macroglobulin family)